MKSSEKIYKSDRYILPFSRPNNEGHNNPALGKEKATTGGIVRCKTVSMRERLLRKLLGETGRVMVIVPGGSVQTLCVQEVPEVGSHECA